MTTETFTLVHVVLSLVGIAAGLVVMWGLVAAKRLEAWTALFLATTVLTSVTAFGFPIVKLGPPHHVGFISLAALAVAIAARYAKRLAGPWRAAYVVAASLALYLNCFVGVAQAFQKIPALHALAPTQQEPPFALAQVTLLGIFVALTTFALRRFRPDAPSTPAA